VRIFYNSAIHLFFLGSCDMDIAVTFDTWHCSLIWYSLLGCGVVFAFSTYDTLKEEKREDRK
jgi:hypothetical protein